MVNFELRYMSFKSSSTIQHSAFNIIYKGVHLGHFERNHISGLFAV